MLSPMKQRAMVRGPASLWFSGLRRHAAAMAERRVVWTVTDGAPIRGSHREVAGIDSRTQESNLARLT